MEISLGDAIKKFLDQSRLKGGIQALQIKEIWESMMGKTIANYTDDIQIIGKTLFISTNTGPLKNELMYQKEKIQERVNEHFGKKVVEEVVIR